MKTLLSGVQGRSMLMGTTWMFSEAVKAFQVLPLFVMNILPMFVINIFPHFVINKIPLFIIR
ncbi:MAG: hypothetical protein ACTTJZ_00255 [Sphaerochaetaceae bacterium]